MSVYVIEVEGLSSLDDFDTLDARTKDNIQRAVNRAADRAKTMADRDIRDNLNIKKSNLAKRLSVVKRATRDNPEAVIRAEDDPVSLAQFKTGVRKKGVTVEVTPGSPKTMGRAFLLFNDKVLAMRLKPGESFRNKKYVKQVDSGLYALYGPSIDQAFRMVAEDRVDEVADFLENEFLRLQGTEL